MPEEYIMLGLNNSSEAPTGDRTDANQPSSRAALGGRRPLFRCVICCSRPADLACRTLYYSLQPTAQPLSTFWPTSSRSQSQQGHPAARQPPHGTGARGGRGGAGQPAPLS